MCSSDLAMTRGFAVQSRLPECLFEEFHAALRHAGHHRLDLGMIERLQQRGIDAVRLGFAGNPAEQRAEPLAGMLADRLDMAGQFAGVAVAEGRWFF